MPFIPYRDESRKNYGEIRSDENANLCKEQLSLGCLMRIADSIERMEKPYTRLLDDIKWLRAERDRLLLRNEQLRHSCAGLKGALRSAKRK